MSRGRQLLAALALAAGIAPALAAETPKRVLVLRSFGGGVEPYETLESGFRSVLPEAVRGPVELHEMSLDFFGPLGTEAEEPVVAYLQALAAKCRLDLVVTIGGPAARLIQRHRSEVFTATPLLIAGSDVRHLTRDALTPLDAEVTVRVDLGSAFGGIFRLLPETTGVVAILGTSPIEKLWARAMREEFASYADKRTLTIWNDLPFDQIVGRSAKLPPGTVILFGMLALDAQGVLHSEDAALAAIRSVANAPIFGLLDSQLGQGIVGGSLVPVRRTGEDSARAAARLLAGEPPSSVRPDAILPGEPQFDSRELIRWGIPPGRLPEHSTIHFRQAGMWETHRWSIVGLAVVLLLEAALIVVLVTTLAGRRRAEAVTRDLSRRLIVAQEEERARLGRELHDDVTQRVARLAIDVGKIERDLDGAEHRGLIRQVREGLVKLSEDVHALSYRLHPSLLDDLGLPDALQVECERFTNATSLPAAFLARDVPDEIPRGVAICLFRVAQEALRNVQRHAAAHAVDISLRRMDGGLQLAVHDDGVGFDQRTDRARRSLGHASMRERLDLVGGDLDVESAPGHGTTVIAWVPLRKGAA